MVPSITRRVWQQMRAHSRREYPLECCGLLSGRGERIERATEATNELASETAFSIPPTELIAFFKALREGRERFLGIYHSHPQGPAEPSQRDLHEFSYPEATYWIVSGPETAVRCFRWKANRFEPSSFQISVEPQPFEH